MIGRLTLLACGLGLLALPQTAPVEAGCARCGWKGPAARRVVAVADTPALERAIDGARPGDAVVLAPGQYHLRRMLDVRTPDVTIRGRSTDPSASIIHGGGMIEDPVGVALSISATGVTIADLTIRDVRYHGIQVRGEQGASGFTAHNVAVMNTGQQLLKGSLSNNGRFADDGLVACSEFSYTTSAPSTYTNGVDLIGAKGWVIRDNRFARIRGPARDRWASGPAVLVWGASEGTVVERNLIVDSFRGIALGLAAGLAKPTRNGEAGYDHLRGVIRNNVIVNANAWADEAIEVNAGVEVEVHHNTVLVEGSTPWSVGVRFPSGSARVMNNLLNRPVLLRQRARAEQAGNVIGADRSWFVDAARLDFHLSPNGWRAVDAGVLIAGLAEDFDRRPRVAGKAPDAGAFESGSRAR